MKKERHKVQDTRHKTEKLLFLLALCLWFWVFSLESAQASTLLYSRLTDGFWQIWKKTEDNQNTQLTASLYDKRYPSATKNGEIIFHTNNNRCFLLTKDGKEVELLSDLWPVRDIVASPTEDVFIFSRFRTDIVDESNIWLYDRTNEKRVMLTREEGIQFQPAISKDGKKIVYSIGNGPRTYEIYSINIDGTEKKQLTENKSNDYTPSFSPDRAKIAFSSNMSGDYEIWTMNADGSEPKQLTDSPGLDTAPAWSSDGKQIAFTTNRSGHLSIWTMNADGSNPLPLLEDLQGNETCDPFWY